MDIKFIRWQAVWINYLRLAPLLIQMTLQNENNWEWLIRTRVLAGSRQEGSPRAPHSITLVSAHSGIGNTLTCSVSLFIISNPQFIAGHCSRMSDVIRMARDDDTTRYDQISFREYHFWLRICQWRMLIIYHLILDQDLNRKYKISLGNLVLDAKCLALSPLKNSCLVSRYHPLVAFGQIVLCLCYFLLEPFWSYVMPHYWGFKIVRPCLRTLSVFKRYFGVKLYRKMFFTSTHGQIITCQMLVELHIICYLLRNNGTLGSSLMSYLGLIQKNSLRPKPLRRLSPSHHYDPVPPHCFVRVWCH